LTFWRYSLRLYRAEGVADACLALQDRSGADVNVLLFCCWTGSRGQALSVREIRAALATVRRWQREVVLPLREARRALKRIIADLHAAVPGIASGTVGADTLARLRKRIAAEELAAEHVEQQLLAAFAAGLPAATRVARPEAAVAGNLERYAGLLGTTLAARERRCLEVLKDAWMSGTRRLPRN
jgi:uncharacterized protein (TIGR02444 family)